MIPEILPFLLPVGKFILATALLVLFYQLFYKGKSTFNQSRVYLLSIVVVALLISQFHIVVFSPPVKTVVVEAQKTVSPVEMQVGTLVKDAPTTSAIQKAKEETSLMNLVSPFLTAQNIVLMLYGLVTLILLLSFIIQYLRILSIRRKGVVCQRVGFEIVESAAIPTPFSFCKTIFIGKNLSGNKLEVILKHEQWHIKHHHYVDVMVMEMLVRIFWFNPVLWWVRKELRNVSEYQEDRSVLDEGHDLYKYQTIILEEVMEQNPYLANGFNNSFTKKRFIMMKNNFRVRFTMLRRVTLIPFLVGVFCLLCFTEGKGETIYVMNDNPATIPENEIIDTLSNSGLLDQTFPASNLNFKVDNTSNLNDQEIDKGIIKTSASLGLAIDELAITIKSKTPASRLLSLQKVVQLMSISFNSGAAGQNQINEQFSSSVTREDLINSRTDFIRIKKEMDALKLEKNNQLKAQKFSILVLSMIKVNLVAKVLQAQMGGLTSMLEDMMTPMVNAMGTALGGLSSEMKVEPEKDTTNPVEIDEPKVEENEIQLKPSQIKVSRLSYSGLDNGIQIVSIEKMSNATMVTIAVSMRKDKNWVSFDKGFTIIDKKNQDQYIIRRLEGDLPLNQKMIVSGYDYKALEFTLEFPPLKKSVDIIDIVEFQSNEDGASGIGLRTSNIKIKDYLKKVSGKVYR